MFAPGAVSATTEVTIQESAVSIPAEYGLLGKSYDLKPDGLSFGAGSVTLALPLATGSGSVWVSSASGYDALPTTVGGGKAQAALPHFSTVFAGAACAPDVACTPKNPCHHGTTTCNGPPACADLNTNVSDGAACCTAGTCTSGFCQASSFDGTYVATAIFCAGVPATGRLAGWIVPPSTFKISQNGSAGYTIFTNGSCTITQLHGVVGTWSCAPSATACAGYSNALFGAQICGSPYDDTGTPPAPTDPVPACSGGSFTVQEAASSTLCSAMGGGSNPASYTLVRQ